MRFRTNWDDYLIQQIEEIEQSGEHNNKIMLTTYPIGYTLPNNIPKEELCGTYLVPWKFDNEGMLRQKGRLLSDSSVKSDDPKRFRHYLYAGGFNFAPACVLNDVPYDTMGLPHLFFGEEMVC
jgi:hypothetical protein